jgi:hypothetical protein
LIDKAKKVSSNASLKWTQAEAKYRTEGGMSSQELKLKKELDEVNAKIKKESDRLDEEIKHELNMLGFGSVIKSVLITILITAVLCAVGATILGMAIYAANPVLGERLEEANIVMALTMPVVFIAIWISFRSSTRKLDKKATKRATETVNNRVSTLQARAKQLEEQLKDPSLANSRLTGEKLELVKKSCEKERGNARALMDEAQECYNKAEQIKEILDQCYDKSGIVPPDYRYIDCLVVVQHAFRNGLADSMKEAVLYYEQKEFRNQVIRGVNNIHEMLGQLAGTMNEVRGILSSIDNNVYGIMRNQEVSNNIQSARMYAEKEFHEAQLAHNKWVEKTFSSFEYNY